MMKPEETIYECDALITALDIFDGFLKENRSLDIRHDVGNRKKLAEIERDFDINPGEYYTNYIKVTEYSVIQTWDEGSEIAWSDDDCQPEIGERLYVVSFPCGAYTLHRDYPQGAFKELFDKLNSFGPKYSDTTNKSLYFSPEKTKDVHNALLDLVKEAMVAGKKEAAKKRIEELEKELEKLDDFFGEKQ